MNYSLQPQRSPDRFLHICPRTAVVEAALFADGLCSTDQGRRWRRDDHLAVATGYSQHGAADSELAQHERIEALMFLLEFGGVYFSVLIAEAKDEERVDDIAHCSTLQWNLARIAETVRRREAGANYFARRNLAMSASALARLLP